MLKFDEATTRLLEAAYAGADVTRRRQASFDALRPGPGETIVDIGCGNGLLTAELALAVGPEGRVVGVDPSEAMRSAAEDRCAAHPQVELLDGMADALPLEDASADKAVSVQVIEYVADIAPALAEAMRVLRPNGRLVVSDVHMDAFLWHSDDPDRMARMMRSWDAHFAHRGVSADVVGWLKGAGHVVEAVIPHTMVDHQLRPDGVATMMMHLMRGYAIQEGHVPEAEARAWFDEQVALAEAGRFFFSMTQFVVVARKG